MMKKVFYLLLLLLLFGCGLKRSNPLDPEANSNIIIPEQVSGVVAYASPANVANKYVQISWSPNSNTNTDGYYIYRGLSFFSAYVQVASVNYVNSYDHISVLPGDYYYRVSAYKTYGGGKLEGKQSAPVFVRVPN